MKRIKDIIKWEDITDFTVPIVRKTDKNDYFNLTLADSLYLLRSVKIDEIFFHIARLKYRDDIDNPNLTASELTPFQIDH